MTCTALKCTYEVGVTVTRTQYIACTRVTNPSSSSIIYDHTVPPGNRSEPTYRSLPSYTKHSATAVSTFTSSSVLHFCVSLASTHGPRGHCTALHCTMYCSTYDSHTQNMRVVFWRSLPTRLGLLDSGLRQP